MARLEDILYELKELNYNLDDCEVLKKNDGSITVVIKESHQFRQIAKKEDKPIIENVNTIGETVAYNLIDMNDIAETLALVLIEINNLKAEIEALKGGNE